MIIWFMMPIVAIFFLALYVLFIYFRARRNQIVFKNQQRALNRKVFELSFMSSLSQQIGYSLSIKTIAETIALSAPQLTDLTTVSYALIQNEVIVLKDFLKVGAQGTFLHEIERIMLAGMNAIDEKVMTYARTRLPNQLLTEEYTVLPFDLVPRSYFNIPLFLDDTFVGMITVASHKAHMYEEEDMNIVYKIVAQAEQAFIKLRQVILTEHEKVSSLLKDLPAGVIQFTFEDNVFNISFINRAASELLALSENPEIEEIFNNMGAIHFTESLKKVLQEKKPVSVQDIQINKKYCNVIFNPVFLHQSNSMVGISVVFEDVTFQKTLQIARQNFTDMVVHELRAPLTSIKGASSLLLNSEMKHEDFVNMVHLIHTSSNQMIDDVGQLLDAAKIEQGRFEIHKDKGDINKIISEKTELFSSIAGEKHISIHATPDASIGEFFLDTARVGQVINNLISNSIKYTHEGGSITVKSALEAGFVKVSVNDTGIGIPEEKKGMLFGKYGQVHPELLSKGTGLGLYISKAIVTSHGGKIWVDSTQGIGTTISFTIPFATTEEKTAPLPPVPAPPQPQKIVN